MGQSVKISVVLPAYNEEENLAIVTESLESCLRQYDYEIIYVDDGSQDNSLKQLRLLNERNSRLKFLSFSRNFGHQQALRAGLDHASGDCVIVMDADMQHPTALILKMIDHWQQGHHVVYTLRTSYEKVSLCKRFTSIIYYRILSILSHHDYCRRKGGFLSIRP
jgi:glycosyltransferase involved in cell wall biosynthesis